MKAVATGLLVGAAGVFIVARVLESTVPWLGYVRATAEAAMVGALADWFAVTALFRHPLGVPIPHTAIIQTRKDQIGNSLGNFVRDNFLTAEVVTDRLHQVDLASRIGDWLVDPGNARTVSAQSAAVVRGVTEVLQDDLVQGSIEHLVATRVRRLPAAPLLGKAVDAAIDGDHHQVLLEALLTSFEGFLDDNRSVFRERLEHESPWWVPDSIDDVVFDRMYRGVKEFLADLRADRHHQMRLDLDRRIWKLAEALKTSPEMHARGEELKEVLLDHPEVRAWSATLWTRIKTGLLDAADDPDSELRLRMEQALIEAGQSLQTDPEVRSKINRWIIEATGYVAEQIRHEVAELIGSTVKRWDTVETADRLELQVGRDLQFIRINGTLVGGFAGLVIYTVSELLL